MTELHDATEAQREEVLRQMNLALENENESNLYYVGGTLCVDIEDTAFLVLLSNKNLSEEERRVAARLYMWNKTPKHHYYEMAQEILAQ